jgi:hypothetical protein
MEPKNRFVFDTGVLVGACILSKQEYICLIWSHSTMTMPELPVMTDQNMLPPGVHDATMEEVRERFGTFQKTNRRCRLFEKLAEYVKEVQKAGCEVIVDGSFVMSSIDEPDDIDLVLILPDSWDFAAELKPFEYNLISKRQVKKFYGFDVFAVRANSPEQREWIDFFSKVNVKWCQPLDIPVGTRKGLVRVVA